MKRLAVAIENDKVASATAVGLALAHVLTFYFWWSKNFLFSYTDGAWSSCYHFFPTCQKVISFSALTTDVILWVYLSLALLAAILLLKKNRLGLWTLLLVSILKILLYYGRYDLMGNYHTMHFVMIAAFFILPNKRLSLPFVLATLYFCAGLLKVSREWLSGAALVSRPILQGEFLLISLAYVVVMELVLIWGLVARSPWIRFITLTQLFLFHAFSWHLVGYFYPLMMGLLLITAWYPFVIRDFSWPVWHSLPKPALIFVSLLLLANFRSHLGDDSALDGGRRWLSLNMMDARSECRQWVLLTEEKSGDSIETLARTTLLQIPQLEVGVRVRCDPLLLEGYLRRYCGHLQANQKLSFVLDAKRATDATFKRIRSYQDFCHGS